MSWTHTFAMMCRIGLTICLVMFSNFYDVRGDVIAYRSDNSSERFNSMPSNFGARIPSEGLVGYLVNAEPTNGCIKLADPPKTNKTATWFALIRRNDCDFDLKVLNAQNSGYTAVIVHNVGSNSMLPMSGNKYSQQVFIPSVFVGEHDGLRLSSEYNYTSGQLLKITPYITLPPGYYLFPFITVTGTCLLFFAIYTIAKYVRDRRRLRRARLSRDHLKKLPIKKFKKGDDYDVCAICLDEYETGDKLRILPCNHAFHTVCVDPWLTNNKRTCPVCKRKVVPNGCDDSSDSDSSDEEEGPTENTPLLNAIGIGNTAASGSESSGSPRRMDASTAMTPAEDSSDDSSIDSNSDSDEVAHGAEDEPGTSRPLKQMAEIQIEHEVLIERPNESDSSYDDDTDDDDQARLQKV